MINLFLSCLGYVLVAGGTVGLIGFIWVLVREQREPKDRHYP